MESSMGDARHRSAIFARAAAVVIPAPWIDSATSSTRGRFTLRPLLSSSSRIRNYGTSASGNPQRLSGLRLRRTRAGVTLTDSSVTRSSSQAHDLFQEFADVGIGVVFLKEYVALLEFILGHAVRPPLHLHVRRVRNDERR